MSNDSINNVVTIYWKKYYCTNHCTLCGDTGVIDLRWMVKPKKLVRGIANYCICPEGQKMRKNKTPYE
jgi:hypothetical protein